MLSRYKLFERIGSGGIGLVYRAEDRSLRRDVALKFLSDESLGKKHVLARFLREARLAAALNHPSICTIHEVGEVGPGEELQLDDGVVIRQGAPFIVMELVNGRPLDAIVDGGAMPVTDLLEVAVQIVDGLVEAHSKSIVHRDLKPRNVMVTPDGRVKILDFGLAKPLTPADDNDAVMRTSEVLSTELTYEGMVVGTVAYMSPEQAQGHAIDARTDIFSFGVMLYEMATGKKPFGGESVTSTLAKILETEPRSVMDTRPDLPPELGRIIHRCLRKPADDRYNDTRDLSVALRDLLQEASSGAVRRAVPGASLSAGSGGVAAAKPRAPRARFGRWTLPVAALAVLVAAGLFGVRLLPQRAGGRLVAAPPTFRQITFTGTASFPALSRDGRSVAYVDEGSKGGRRVMVRDIAGGQPLEVFEAAWVKSVRWSPAGTELLVSGSSPAGAVHTFVVPRLGGMARQLPYLPFAAWSPDGARLAGASLPSKRIEVVDTTTGEGSAIALGGSFQWFYQVDWSPSHDVLAYLTGNDDDHHAIWTTTVDGATQQVVVEESAPLLSPRFSLSGDGVYYLKDREQTRELWKAPVDPRTGAPSGEPRLLLAGLETGDHMAFSDDGLRLLYTKEASHSNLWLVEVAEDGGRPRTTRLTSGTQEHGVPSISPDVTRLAFTRGSKSRANVFIMDLEDTSFQQLTFLDAETWRPAWSPNGEQIAFGSTRGGVPRVWRIGSSGGAPNPFEKTSLGDDLTWAPGSRILYQRPGNNEYRFLDVASEQEMPLSVGASGASADPLQFFSWMASPVYAPDGRRVAINCNCPDGAGVWLASRRDADGVLLYENEQAMPVGWSGDGSLVYVFVPDTRTVFAVPESGGAPEVVVEVPFRDVDAVAVTPDGKRVVCTVPERQSDLWLLENFEQ